MLPTAPEKRIAFGMFYVGWGANQFAPMVQVYRLLDGLPQTAVTAAFGIYALGLIPVLLLSGWQSNRFGNRAFVRLALVLAVSASVILAAGAWYTPLLFVGRLVAGAAAGAVMASGTAWIQHLATATDARSGARRAAIALSTGFGLGPLVAALASTMLPGPRITPYLLHIAAGLLLILPVWRAPEPDSAAHPVPGPRTVIRALWHRWFLVVAVAAPWVFGAGSLSFVVMPSLLQHQGGQLRVLAIGFAAALTLGTGVVVQPFLQRLEGKRAALLQPLALATLAIGCLLALAQAALGAFWLLVPASLTFGAAYGGLLVGGLRRVHQHVGPELLAPANAVFYSFTYIGFLTPYAVAVATELWSLPGALVIGLALVLATLAFSLLNARR